MCVWTYTTLPSASLPQPVPLVTGVNRTASNLDATHFPVSASYADPFLLQVATPPSDFLTVVSRVCSILSVAVLILAVASLADFSTLATAALDFVSRLTMDVESSVVTIRSVACILFSDVSVRVATVFSRLADPPATFAASLSTVSART